MDRYTHLYQGDLSAALNVLPNLSRATEQVQSATGTDGAQAKSSDPRLARFLVHFGGGSGEKRSHGRLNPIAFEDSTAVREHAEPAGNTQILTEFPTSAIVVNTAGRSGRAAECAGLENR